MKKMYINLTIAAVILAVVSIILIAVATGVYTLGAISNESLWCLIKLFVASPLLVLIPRYFVGEKLFEGK